MATITTADGHTVEPTPGAVESADSALTNMTMARNIKLGMFHIGSSLADILTSGVWNRIAITELGIAATPVALLVSLKYFIAPLSIWAGQRSDVSHWRGYRRLPFVWGGRLLMMLSFFLLGTATVTLAGDTTSGWGWAGVMASFLIFSVGSALSGTTFLSLVYDITPKAQRTRTISVIWFFLITGFAGAGILYGQLLPHYTEQAFIALFIIAPLIMGGLWFLSLVGEEKPDRNAALLAQVDRARPFMQDLREAWANKQTRLFFVYLALTNLFFYTQDVILEPFGGQVFGMDLRTTNRFSAYWGSMALLGIVISLVAARRYPKLLNNLTLSKWSLGVLVVGFAMFLISAVFLIRPLVTIALVVMGVGLGIWTVGGLGLMMDMTRTLGAGLYLSLWTIASTLARGTGTALGGVVKDIGLVITGTDQPHLAYGLVFLVQVIGFIVSYVVLVRVDVDLFHKTAAPAAEPVMADGLS